VKNFTVKPSKAERRQQQKVFKRKKSFKDNLNYYIFIGFAIAFVAFFKFKPLTIGHDVKQLVLVHILPIVVGITLCFVYRKKLFNIDNFTQLNSNRKKAGAVVILSVAVAIGSYITLGLITNVTWECANYYTAKNEKTQTVILPVDEFHKSSGKKSKPSIKFHFQGKKERIGVSKNYIQQLLAESSTKKHIRLRLRKGLWNHYLVDDWDIVR